MKAFWCCGHQLKLQQPLIMGILNATPDSFVPTSRVDTVARALACAREMVMAGATLLDVGGESTRPGATMISAAEEIERVVPVIEALHRVFPHLLISIDTSKVAVAQEAVAAGATIINDVRGTHPDPGMWKFVQSSGAGYVLMHSRGDSQTMDALTHYENVIEEVLQELLDAAHTMEALGVHREQIMFDVGLGFAKTNDDSMRLLEATDRFAATPYPVLVGASHKRFLAQLCVDVTSIEERSAIAARMAVERGANIVRVHDVLETRHQLEGISHV